MSELVEFEEPGTGDVFNLVEDQARDLQGLVDLALAGADFTPIDESQLKEIWENEQGFSGSWRHESSYDPIAQSPCAVIEMLSLKQQPEKLAVDIDPYKPDDNGSLIIEPAKTFQGHWLGVVWEDIGQNYLIDLEHSVVYTEEKGIYVPIKGKELVSAHDSIIQALSAIIDDII